MRLDRLISDYPELVTPFHDIDCDNTDGFDPSAPKIVTGVVLLITTRDVNDYENMFLEKPEEQSHFHTLGMVKAALDQIL